MNIKYEFTEVIKEGTTFKVSILWKPNFIQRIFSPFEKCLVIYVGDESDMVFEPIEHMSASGEKTIIPNVPTNIPLPTEKFFNMNLQ